MIRRQGDLGNFVQQNETLRTVMIAAGASKAADGVVKVMPRLPRGWNVHVSGLHVWGCLLYTSRHVVAHQHRENPVRLGGALDVHFAQNARLRRHGRFPQLFGIHLSQTFVPLYVSALGSELLERGLAFLLGPAVAAVLAFLDLIERRRRDIDEMCIRDSRRRAP